MRAELRAASIRFKIAWELGYRKVHLQMDSLAAVKWRNRDWEIRISHVFREANRVADLLAHLRHNLPLGTHLNCPISKDIERCILSDCIGVAFPRVCSHSN
ncbi:hypothetical protein LINPERHAP1_LOCUS8681 [Linum perenne]